MQASSRWRREEQAWRVSGPLPFLHLPAPGTARKEPLPQHLGLLLPQPHQFNLFRGGEGRSMLFIGNFTDVPQTSQLFELGICDPIFQMRKLNGSSERLDNLPRTHGSVGIWTSTCLSLSPEVPSILDRSLPRGLRMFHSRIFVPGPTSTPKKSSCLLTRVSLDTCHSIHLS